MKQPATESDAQAEIKATAKRLVLIMNQTSRANALGSNSQAQCQQKKVRALAYFLAIPKSTDQRRGLLSDEA
jgi:fumarate hydratase class II